MREREKWCKHKNGRFACQLSGQWGSSSFTYTARERSKARWEMPRTNYLIKFSFSYHRQLAKPCLIVAYMLRYSFVHAPINWQWSREGRVLITVWVVSIRVSVSCALKRKEDWCDYSNAKHTSKGLYLPHTDEWKKLIADDRTSDSGSILALPIPYHKQTPLIHRHWR